MLRHTQTVVDKERGNCLQAAVASFLGLPLDDVPHFVLHKDWEARFLRFMREKQKPVRLTTCTDQASGIAVGPTVRGTFHAVVMLDGAMVWDPHPSRTGLLRVSYVYTTDSP